MVDYSSVQQGVRGFKRLLDDHGIECSTTAEDLIAWFQADAPYPDFGVDEMLEMPLIVAHELVKIHEVKKMGLKLTNEAILKNP